MTSVRQKTAVFWVKRCSRSSLRWWRQQGLYQTSHLRTQPPWEPQIQQNLRHGSEATWRLKEYLCRCSVSLPVCCASGRSIRDIRWRGDVCCDGVVGTVACVAAALASTVWTRTYLKRSFDRRSGKNPLLDSDELGRCDENLTKKKLRYVITRFIIAKRCSRLLVWLRNCFCDYARHY